MKVALLMGGRSSEREISLKTGQGVAQALRSLGHEVTSIDTANGRLLPPGEELRAALPEGARVPAVAVSAVANADAVNQAEVVFLALHGGPGEDGTIQALLDLAGKPYTGSGVLASALAMNKAMSKRVFEREGIPTPEWMLLTRDAGDADAASRAILRGQLPRGPRVPGNRRPGELSGALCPSASVEGFA